MTTLLATEIFVSWYHHGWAYYTPSEVKEAWNLLKTLSITDIEHAIRNVYLTSIGKEESSNA